MSGFQYENIRKQLEATVSYPNLPWESALVSLIALLKTELPKLSWVGFYRNIDGHLWISSYQGKLACLHLKPGQGVCGQALAKNECLIVDDVEAYPGHVACDPLSRSEIVLPVRHAGRLIGVLDLDSHQPAAFNADDRKFLEDLLKAIEHLPDRVSYSV